MSQFSEQIQLVVPVTVKVVVTPTFRANMIAEVEHSLAQIDSNLQRLEQIRADGSELARVHGEQARLRQAREELNWRIREAESLRDGAEIFYQDATSSVTLKLGDDYLAACQREIIIQDGKIIAIRNSAAVQG